MPVQTTQELVRGHLRFGRRPVVAGWASVGGRMEGQGPFGEMLDQLVDDDYFGEKTYERAERKLFVEATKLALERCALTSSAVDLLVGGDLLDQIVTANFGARDLGLPFIGVYGACSTSSESLLLAAMAVDGGYARRAVAATASHHLCAERQYRYPIELGVQRTPTQQWTATGGAAFVLDRSAGDGSEPQPAIARATVGHVLDYGLKDPNNMGAAMAPAAADVIARHLRAADLDDQQWDLVMTGDLGRVGLPLLQRLLAEQGIDLGDRLQDAGCLLYAASQQVQAGASGAACSALLLATHVLPQLRARKLRRALIVATGSLHSPRTYQQGEPIPVTAHAVEIVS